MSDEQDRSVRRVKFSGDQDDWRVWQAQFMALAFHKGYQEVLTGEVECPPAAKKLVAGKDDAEDLLIKARRMNGAAYSALVLSSVDDVFFNAVDEAKTSALPNGDAFAAWNNLLDRYEPKTALVEVELRREFARSKLADDVTNPDTFFFKLKESGNA